jgi:hypothetical protein
MNKNNPIKFDSNNDFNLSSVQSFFFNIYDDYLIKIETMIFTSGLRSKGNEGN